MRLTQIWNYPVKSMVGEQVAEADVGPDGIRGDRHWAVRDEVKGGIRGAKKIADLMRLAARRQADGSVLIHLPDGTTMSTADHDRDRRLSTALGQEVTLQQLAPPTDLDHYRRGEPDSDDFMVELRSIFGREDDEPFPDFGIFPPEIIEFESPPGTHHDAFPLLVLSTSAMRTLAEALPGSVIDERRFRPSLVVDTGDEPGHPEFAWVGRRMRIGEVELDVAAACPRCVMVTRAVDDTIPADREVLRHIVRDLDQNVGVYATVVTPGTVREGDEVAVLG
jgi:MOSC domain-containing protein